MTESQARPVVAVVNTNDDLVQALRHVLETEGYAVVTTHIRDIKAGKPSELEAWTGAVVRLGRQTGTPTPLNNILYELASARSQAGSQTG